VIVLALDHVLPSLRYAVVGCELLACGKPLHFFPHYMRGRNIGDLFSSSELLHNFCGKLIQIGLIEFDVGVCIAYY